MMTTLARFQSHHSGDSGWLQCGHPGCDAQLESDITQVTEHRNDIGVTAEMLRGFARHMEAHDAFQE